MPPGRRRRLTRLIGGAVLAVAGLAAGFLAWLFLVWPPPSWWRSHWPEETAFMRLRARQYAAARDTIPRRYRPVPLDSMVDGLERAATVAEDDAFFQHHGLDFRQIREALGYRRDAFSWRSARDRAELWRALGRAAERRERLRGASTITQQLAKNLYLSPSRNPLRKLKEAAVAVRLEWALSKPRILELYLNVAEFGPNLWGVEAAGRRYFGRGAARLTLEQATLLIATLPHPLTSNPAFRPGRTRYRQQLILRRLRGEDVEVPQAEAEDLAPAAPADSAGVPPRDTTAAADTAAARDSTGPGRDSLVSPPGAAASPDTGTTRNRSSPPAPRSPPAPGP